ncbi:MAG: FadR/GntR family transcriptional regulator, partial [Christensenellaceae bacterium]|nr:FadR/GntR family transcriptional regulator [Christensenellaceae bacterium]
RKNDVSTQVYDQMREMILRNVWKPGDRLPSENELAESFGVSRVTIRQALLKMNTFGLIRTRQGEGSFVQEMGVGIKLNELVPSIYLNENAVRDVWEFRMMTEVETVALATKRATAEDIRQLWASYERLKDQRDDLEDYISNDFQFHRMLTTIVGNQLVTQLHYLLRDILKETMRKITLKIGRDNGIEYHRRIIEAIEARDAQMARKLMTDHLAESLKLFEGP